MIVTVDTHEGWPGRGLEEAAESEASVGSTVLIADDDRAIRESLARALELEGYEVVSVDDGIKALTRIHHENFDTLILDVMMPNLDGLGVCRVLRSEAESENLAVLYRIFTAQAHRRRRARGHPHGARCRLHRPHTVNVPTRLALAFALVAAVVAGAVGLLSYHSAEQQTFDEIDRSLQSAATALASGQSAVLSPSFVDLPGPGGPGGGSGGPRTTATGRPS